MPDQEDKFKTVEIRIVIKTMEGGWDLDHLGSEAFHSVLFHLESVPLKIVSIQIAIKIILVGRRGKLFDQETEEVKMMIVLVFNCVSLH